MSARSEDEVRTYSADDARQGQIILTTRTRRTIFVVGLIAAVLLALVMRLTLSA